MPHPLEYHRPSPLRSPDIQGGAEAEGKRFAGKTAIVTGTRGVAEKVIELLVREGARKVIATYTPVEDTPLGRNKLKRVTGLRVKIDAVNEEVGGHTILDTQPCDLANPEQRQGFLNYVKATNESVDLAYLNAANGFVRSRAKEGEEREAAFRQAEVVSKGVNYDAKMDFVEGLAPLLAKADKPVVVNISSTLSRKFGQIPGIPEYDPVARWKNKAEVELPGKVEEVSKKTGASINFAEVCATGIEGTSTWGMLEHWMADKLEGMSEEGPTNTEIVAKAVVKLAVEDVPFGHIEYVGVPERDRT